MHVAGHPLAFGHQVQLGRKPVVGTLAIVEPTDDAGHHADADENGEEEAMAGERVGDRQHQDRQRDPPDGEQDAPPERLVEHAEGEQEDGHSEGVHPGDEAGDREHRRHGEQELHRRPVRVGQVRSHHPDEAIGVERPEGDDRSDGNHPPDQVHRCEGRGDQGEDQEHQPDDAHQPAEPLPR